MRPRLDASALAPAIECRLLIWPNTLQVCAVYILIYCPQYSSACAFVVVGKKEQRVLSGCGEERTKGWWEEKVTFSHVACLSNEPSLVEALFLSADLT